MPRPLIGPANNVATSARTSNADSRVVNADELLRIKRPKSVIDLITALDAGERTIQAATTGALIDQIRNELPEVYLDLGPVGFVARCYLGEPFEVHTLDFLGSIVQHYKRSEPLPADLEKARALALHPTYAYIEVYSNKLVAVDSDGNTSILGT